MPSLVNGPLADPTGAGIAVVLTKYAAPDDVLGAPPEDLFVPENVAVNFADARRTYPIHTKAAAWISAAYYHDSGSDDAVVGDRIKLACQYHQIGKEWNKLASLRPQHVETQVTYYALPAAKKYPLDTPEQVKAADEYFTKYASYFPAEDRRTYAGEMVKAAIRHPQAVTDLWRLEAEAGLGLPAEGWETEFAQRAKKALELGDEDLAAVLDKTAVDFKQQIIDRQVSPMGTFTNAGELSDLLKKADRKYGWNYGDPLGGLVGDTPSTAGKKLAGVVRSAAGNWYVKEAVDAVPDNLFTELVGCGPVVSRETKLGLLQDATKVAAVERLLNLHNVEPVERAKPQRVDWEKLAAGI